MPKGTSGVFPSAFGCSGFTSSLEGIGGAFVIPQSLAAEVVEVGLAVRAADHVEVELDVVQQLRVAGTQQEAAELLPRRTAHPLPPPDRPDRVLAPVLLLFYDARYATPAYGPLAAGGAIGLDLVLERGLLRDLVTRLRLTRTRVATTAVD